MREQIKLLTRLQKLDKKIQKLEKGIAIVPEAIIALEEIVSQGNKQAEEIREKLENVEKKRRHKEGELSIKEGSLSKYQSQLYEVKTNREYSALMIEIDSLKQENSEIENEILVLMERGDELKVAIERRKEEVREGQEKLAEEERKNQERVSNLREELRKRQGERKGQVGEIETELLSRYDKVRKGKDGLALVPVIAEACQGCFTKLPPQVINEIMQARQMVSCERCSRILYLPDEKDADYWG